jgi:multiple sugar transport system permease protein
MFVIPVVSGLTFRFIFDPESGVFASIFYWFNLESPDFLGDPTLAFLSVIAQDVWRMWPFIFIILYAGLKSIDTEILNAAKIDGANMLQRFRYIVLPAMKGTIIISIILKTIESFKAFTEIYVMTGGGPGESTSILSMYIIKQLTEFNRYGFGSAVSMVLLLSAIIFSLVYGYAIKGEDIS